MARQRCFSWALPVTNGANEANEANETDAAMSPFELD